MIFPFLGSFFKTLCESFLVLFQLAGASYMEVHQAGGGINFTVEKTRAASEDQLLELLMSRLERMLRAGKV